MYIENITQIYLRNSEKHKITEALNLIADMCEDIECCERCPVEKQCPHQALSDLLDKSKLIETEPKETTIGGQTIKQMIKTYEKASN